jgi:NADH:ubiquinone oxidoreductase subunit 4 (subunit M)
LRDVTRIELLYYVPLSIMIIALGVYPSVINELLSPAIQNLMVHMAFYIPGGSL